MRRAASWVALLATMGAASAAQPQVNIEAQDSGVTVRLRGISAVDANIAWASGREGTVLRTLDGGKHWINVSVPEAKDLDFRDIEGFDADNAVVLSIGPGAASRVYRTQDAGKTWAMTLKNDDERAFFDCMVFEDGKGWMLGDPVDGRYQIRETKDGGRTWVLWQNGPEAKKDEAAFAASGTCIVPANYKTLVVVGGGSASRAQVFDGVESWKAYDAPMPHRVPAAGIFSAVSLGGWVLTVGGDFENESQGSAAALAISPHGIGFRPMASPRGYRSGAACFHIRACIAVGPSGVDILHEPIRNRRATWSPVSEIGYDAIDVAGDYAWASGDKGRIARITLSSPPPGSPSKPQPATPPSN